MTPIDLETEWNTCLEPIAYERNEYLEGLKDFSKQFKKARKSLLKRLKNETGKAKCKVLKQELRKVELAYQSIR